VSKKKHLGFGIDIGGSGIKGAPVDLVAGKLADDRVRIDTPQPSTPEAVAKAVRELLDQFGWDGDFGCTFPGVIKRGAVCFAPNIDASWLGVDAHGLFAEVTGRQVQLINDADAAGVAEARFGAARGQAGVVLVSTLGTGIGTGLLLDGRLIPNVELGHLQLDGHLAEAYAASSARERETLSWADWAQRLSRYYGHVERLIWPELIVVGGGVSKHAEKWLPLVEIQTPIVAAALRNEAGIVGAALLAAESDLLSASGRGKHKG
jgi:polyphosphate glucokinase